MPRPFMCKTPMLPLKEESPHCNGNVKHHTPLGKETLKVYVLKKSNHQEKKSYCEQQQAREGIRGVNQKLIIGCCPLKLACGLGSVAKHRDLFGVEYHQSSTSKSYCGMKNTHKGIYRRNHLSEFTSKAFNCFLTFNSMEPLPSKPTMVVEIPITSF